MTQPPEEASPREEAAPRPFAPPADGARTVYRGARLIDLRREAVHEGMAVVTDGATIVAVVPDGDAPDGTAAEVVDLDGDYLMAGLVDSHQHVATPPHRAVAEATLSRQVYGGVTAVRDMADDLRSVAELARAALTGEIAAPDIRFAALMAGRSFFDDPRTHQASHGYDPGAAPWMQAVSGETDLRLAVAVARGTGACAIKVYANLAGPLVEAIAREAHSQGLAAWAHATVAPALPLEVVLAGVDTVSHADLLIYHVFETRPQAYPDLRRLRPAAYARFLEAPADALDDLFAAMAARSTLLDATVDLTALNLMALDEAAAGLARAATGRIVARAAAQGVALSAGTDWETPADSPFPALHGELRLLVELAGLRPAQALRASVEGGARALGQAHVMGSIAKGMRANLVALGANPLEAIENLASVRFTVKRGRRFERAEYDEARLAQAARAGAARAGDGT